MRSIIENAEEYRYMRQFAVYSDVLQWLKGCHNTSTVGERTRPAHRSDGDWDMAGYGGGWAWWGAVSPVRV